MHILIRYQCGKRGEGVVLTHGKDRMRVAVRGRQDVVELWQDGEFWYAESGGPAVIEAMISLPANPNLHVIAGALQLMCAEGGNTAVA